MTDTNPVASAPTSRSPLTTLINILTAPGEAFAALQRHPTKLFPLALIVVCTALVMFWYFSIVDFDWYVDDTLAGRGNLSEEQLKAAREAMLSISQGRFTLIGMIGSCVGALVTYVLLAGYLTMSSALGGDKHRFGHWFSLVCWSNIPALIGVVGMAVTIALSPNGQLSAYDLNPLTLANLGVVAGTEFQTMLSVISLPMLWTIALLVIGYRQWLQASWIKAAAVVLAPYLLILGVSTYFALT